MTPRLIGNGHNELVRWLGERWLADGPPACLLQGFAGVGKSTVARALIDASSYDVNVLVEAGGAAMGRLDDLWLQIAGELEVQGETEMAMAVDRGESLGDAFDRLSPKPILVVVDDAQNLLDSGTGVPVQQLQQSLARIARRPRSALRILLLFDRSLDRGRWSEPHELRTLAPLRPPEAERLLDELLRSASRADEVPADRRSDIAKWLGGNPRALRVLVGALHETPLDELIGLEPEVWEARDREISADLLRRLEEALLERTIARMTPASRQLLERLSVFRASFRTDAITRMASSPGVAAEGRQELVRLFLLDHEREWFRLNDVAREIALGRLRRRGAAVKRAHARAAEHYTRHFEAKQIVNPTRLGPAFVEARYHLTQCDDSEQLSRIAGVFGRHLRERFHNSMSVPKDPAVLHERIVLLSALLASPGAPPSLRTYLARLLHARDDPGDLERALEQSTLGLSLNAVADVWVLHARLTAEARGVDAMLAAVRPALDAGVRNGFSLFQSAAELLAAAGRTDDAIALLTEGISRIAPEQGLFSLYKSAGELLAAAGRTDDAIALLTEGISRIAPEQSLYSLYQALGAVHLDTGRTDLALLTQLAGAARIGASHNGSLLAVSSLLQAARGCDADAFHSVAEELDAARFARQGLADTLGLQLSRQWEAAALGAREASRVDRSAALKAQEAFAFLCAGRPGDARQSIEEIRAGTRTPDALQWLAAAIALKLGEPQRAKAALERYLGRALDDDIERVDERLLVDLWDGPAERKPSERPSYYFPTFELAKAEFLNAPRTRGEGVGDVVVPGARLRVLCVATEWRSRHGGISTFNRSLARAFATAGHEVACLVPDVTARDVAAAASAGVALHEAPRMSGIAGPERLLLNPRLSFEPDLVIGHGRITGPAAKVMADQWFPTARRLHILHTVPAELEWYKELGAGSRPSTVAEERESIERDLARTADLVGGVGPLLYGEAHDLVRGAASGPRVIELLPGIEARDDAPEPPQRVRCLVLGRTTDFELKGLDIAARAFAAVPPIPGLPAPTLIVRGCAPEDAIALRDRLRGIAGTGAAVFVRDYSDESEPLADDLRGASVLLLPSRNEGFGLVVLEAIEAGVPVLVSDHSGVGEWLADIPEAVSSVVAVTGDREQDATTWAQRLDFVLRDRSAAFNRARPLRAQLSERLSWTATVQAIVGALADERASR